jgi:hypothetical protein
MPEITIHGKLFFSIKTIAGWSIAGATGFNAHRNDAPNPFNRPGNTRA